MTSPTFNRNNITLPQRYNRGDDNKYVAGVTQPVAVNLYTIDNAILKYLQATIVPLVYQDGKQIKVPVIYGNPERWKSVQKDGAIRDKNGKLVLPIMMIRRSGMKKNSINNPTNKYQRYTYKSGWNARNVYDRFTVLNGIKPSELYHSSMIPDFYDITYDALIWTEYMEQMNKLVETISFESNEYWGEKNSYRFNTRIDGFEQTTDLPNNNDRVVRSKFNIQVKAYLLPETALNRDGNRGATTKLEYSPKKVVFSTEVVTNLR